MTEKKITSRIVHKHDIETNWNKATNFIPLKGELIVYDIDSTHDYERIKIGDGVTKVSALSFADDTKVDKISGKGLSTNDYTTDEKNKLAGIATGANKTTVDSSLSTSSTNPVQNKVVAMEINNLNTLVGDTAVSTQISDAVAKKADIANGQYAVTVSSSNGVAYTATVPSITNLTTGASFIMIPGRVSASTTPTLNVNGLGPKNIRRRLSNLATGVQTGYSVSWLAANRPFRVTYDGTQWIVEGQDKPAGSDVYGAVAKAKADEDGNVIADTYATIASLQALLPKVTSITLGTSWNGNASPYYQDVALSCCTATSVVDIQPTYTQLADWQDDGLAFTTLSSDGSVRVYVVGGMPTETITVQVKVQEVVVV